MTVRRFLKGAAPSTAAAVLCCGAVVIVIALTAMTLSISRRKHDAIADAERVGSSLVLVLAEHVARTVQSVDLITGAVSADALPLLQDPGATPTARRVLADYIAGVPQIRSLIVVDSDGNAVEQAGGSALKLNVADREYFQVLTGKPTKRLHIGLPVRFRGDGSWVIPMARRIEDDSGQFAGIVVAAVEPAYLDKLFGTIASRDGSTVALYREDGYRLVRYPFLEEEISRFIGTTGLFTEHLPLADAGTYRDKGVISGERRIFNYRRVPFYPLIVRTSIGEAAVLAAWRIEATRIGAASLAGCFVMGALTIAISSQLRRRERLTGDLQESEQRYRTLLETAQEGVWLVDRDFHVEYVNSRMAEMIGYLPAEIVGKCILDFVAKESRGILLKKRQKREAGLSERYEFSFPHRDGGERWVLVSASPRFAAEGTFLGSIVMTVDITERKRAEQLLAYRATQQQALAELAQLALGQRDLDSILHMVAEAVARTLGAEFCKVLELGADRTTLLLRAGVGWAPGLVGRARVPAGPGSQGGYALLTAEPVIVDDLGTETRFETSTLLVEHGVRSGVTAILRRHGEPFGVLGVHARTPSRFSQHEVNFVQSVAHLLSATVTRCTDAEALRIQQTRLQAILDTTADAIVTADDSGRIESLNAAAERLFGYQEGELKGKSLTLLMPEPYRERHDAGLIGYCDSGKSKLIGRGPQEFEALTKDGRAFPIELTLGEIQLGHGRLFIATLRDLTERNAAEQRLRQAQKMEAVGQLTGGIAHDFNNLLTVLLGNAELLEEAIVQPELARMAHVARRAAERGAELTQRLLAFSRQQALRPVGLDLNQVVLGMEDLLRRTLGEHITISIHGKPSLGTAVADKTQVETALLNLALNARDAMPSGGRLTIETGNAELDEDFARADPGGQPGSYIMLAVSDTGTGMHPDILRRAFEPFFTTKDVGKGSGLGLSMVYGFVKQSGGYIRIYSEVGNGTTVKFYLPRSRFSAEHQLSAPTAEPPGSSCGETILVVEDDPGVREYVTAQLRGLGYRVIEAADGVQALELLAGAEKVNLLFSDIVMPGGLTGWQLAERARETRPDLKVVFTSGYTEGAFSGQIDPTLQLLQKPYRKTDLARIIRSTLDDRATPLDG